MIPPKHSTAYSKINVTCEPCHGPGRKPVEMAKIDKGWNGLVHFWLSDLTSGNVAQIESCANVMPVVDSYIPEIMPMILFSITFSLK